MEAMGAFFDEEWDSLGKMFFSEDTDLMLQLHGDGLFSNGSDDTSPVFAAPSIFWPVNGGNENVAGVDGTLMCSDTLDYTNFHNISQESSNSSASDGVFPNPSHEFYQANDINHLQITNDTIESMNFCLADHKNGSFVPAFSHGNVMEDIICPREEIGGEKMRNAESQLQAANVADSGNEMLLKRKFNSSEVQTDAEDGTNAESSENPKKKSRAARNAPKTKRNVQPKSKKSQKDKQISIEEDEPNTAQNGQSSCCYSSEDDSNASQESNGEATPDNKSPSLNLIGKTRATRGSATDPQSLYARRRRERINERLRILQNLIPNGTKVDISTMLEEAVHYVKFMQLQIKLLSSDDMWMYAPIVYNGLDIGLCGKIFPTL